MYLDNQNKLNRTVRHQPHTNPLHTWTILASEKYTRSLLKISEASYEKEEEGNQIKTAYFMLLLLFYSHSFWT